MKYIAFVFASKMDSKQSSLVSPLAQKPASNELVFDLLSRLGEGAGLEAFLLFGKTGPFCVLPKEKNKYFRSVKKENFAEVVKANGPKVGKSLVAYWRALCRLATESETFTVEEGEWLEKLYNTTCILEATVSYVLQNELLLLPEKWEDYFIRIFYVAAQMFSIPSVEEGLKSNTFSNVLILYFELTGLSFETSQLF